MSDIAVRNVSKRYGDVRALEDVSARFESGKIYGLLGRNGAGKTTLLNIMTGRIFADSGGVTLDGEALPENDKALGQISMQGEATFYPENMRIRDVFKWAAFFYPGFKMEYALALAGRFGLGLRSKVKGLSTGYTTIFKLVTTLSTNAPFLLFDEPVLGLDANHRELFYKALLEKFAETGCCAVLSTHLVEEVSALVEDVIILKEGRVLLDEPREQLLARGYTVTGMAAAVDSYTNGLGLLGADAIGGLKTAYVLGQRPASLPEGLETTALDLQKLFVKLTD